MPDQAPLPNLSARKDFLPIEKVMADIMFKGELRDDDELTLERSGSSVLLAAWRARGRRNDDSQTTICFELEMQEERVSQ